MSRSLARSVLLAAALLLLGAAPAHAAFGIANPSAAPADVAAGAHADFRIHLEPQGGKIKDLDLHLPPGVIGDPQATDRCPVARFTANSCPADTQVGTSSTTVLLGPLTQTAAGVIYNIAPRGSEPARLGVRITPPIGGPVLLESPVTSRPDGGLDSTLRDLPQQVSGLDVTITALDIVLKGRANGKPFMTNPTSCGPATTVIDARSYAGEAAQGRASFTPTRCDALPFTPAFEAILGAPGLTARKASPPLRTIITQEREQANVRSVSVTLPTALAVGLEKLSRACPKEGVAAGTCPATSEVGSATAVTPLLTEPLLGPVLFAFGEETLPDLVLNLKGPLALTLRGTNVITPAGQVTTFDGIPDVPLSRFELAFLGGDKGLLSLTRDACVGKAPRLTAVFTSQAGAKRTVTVPAKLEGCAPQIAVRLGSLRKRRPSLRVRVDAGARRLRRVRVTLPSRLRAVSGVARATINGSGTKGARLRRSGRHYDVTIPGAGARSIALSFRAGTLRAARGLTARTGIRVEITDAAGTRIVRTVRPSR